MGMKRDGSVSPILFKLAFSCELQKRPVAAN